MVIIALDSRNLSYLLLIDATDFGNPFWVRGYKNTLPRRASQANMHGKTRAGVVCFSLERKKDFASPWRLFSVLVSHLLLLSLFPHHSVRRLSYGCFSGVGCGNVLNVYIIQARCCGGKTIVYSIILPPLFG